MAWDRTGPDGDRSVLWLLAWGLGADTHRLWVPSPCPPGRSEEGMRVRKQVLCPRNVAFPGDFLADARRGMGKTLALSRRRYWEEVVPTWGGSWLWDRVGPLPGSLWVHRDVGSQVGRECGSGCGDAGGLARQGDGAGLRGEAGADTRASPASAPPALHPAPVLTAPAPAGNWWHHHVPGRRYGTALGLARGRRRLCMGTPEPV